MKCEKCGKEMKNLGLVPRLGRKAMGKQYFKIECSNPACPKYGEIKYIKPGKFKD